MRELVYYRASCKVGTACIYAVSYRELGISVYYCGKHSLANTLAVRHVTHNEVSLVGCHTLARVKIYVCRAYKIVALVKIEHIGICAYLCLQSCLGNAVKHHKRLSTLGCAIVAAANNSSQVVIVVAARSLAHAF